MGKINKYANLCDKDGNVVWNISNEDKEYVKQLQDDLIKKLQDEANKKKQREAAGKTSLEQLDKDIEDAEIISKPVPSDVERTNKGGNE